MEDIDAAFTHSLNRDSPDGKGPGSTSTEAGSSLQGSANAPPPKSRLSLSGLLNALDGVGAQEGRILFATTNKYSSLDPALCRPGRMDLHIEFHNASKYQAKRLYLRFYLPSYNPDDPAEEEEEQVEKESVVDSGYNSSAASTIGDSEAPKIVEVVEAIEKSESAAVASPLTSPTPAEAVPALPLVNGHIPLQPDKPHVIGARHKGSGPKLSRTEMTELACQFADVIPEREFSMAALQGYLMTYKIRPLQAVKDFHEWVLKERREKKEREEKEKREKEEQERKAKEEKEKEEKEKKEKEEKEKKEKEKEEKEKREKEQKDSSTSS
jgi:chaperone BCS1